MRRIADGNAARPRGLPGAAGRQGDVSERHRLDASDPSAGRGGARELGAARPRRRDRLSALDTYAFDFGPFTISGLRERPAHPSPTRRGARCWTSCSWTPPPRPGPRSARSSPSRASWSKTARWSGFADTPEAARRSTEHARVVIGADGRYSLVADAVGAEQYNEKPQLEVSYYSYWSGLADGRPLRDLHPARTAGLRRGPRTTT